MKKLSIGHRVTVLRPRGKPITGTISNITKAAIILANVTVGTKKYPKARISQGAIRSGKFEVTGANATRAKAAWTKKPTKRAPKIDWNKTVARNTMIDRFPKVAQLISHMENAGVRLKEAIEEDDGAYIFMLMPRGNWVPRITMTKRGSKYSIAFMDYLSHGSKTTTEAKAVSAFRNSPHLKR